MQRADDARARYRAAEESGAGAEVAPGRDVRRRWCCDRPRLVRRRLAGRLPPHWIDFRAALAAGKTSAR